MKQFKWVPRILAIFYTFFVSLFALDMFGKGGMLEQAVGFLIHMIPSFVIIVLIIVAWKRPKLSGMLFVVLGAVFTFFFHTYEDAVVFMIISLPLFLVGFLFIISNGKGKKRGKGKK